MIIQDLIDYCNVQSTVDSSTKPAHSLAYFYCSFTDTKKQNSYDLISSLLAKLVRKFPDISSTLRQLHGQCREAKLPMDVIKAELHSILKLLGQTFLVIHALDECPIGDENRSRAKVLALLTELWGWPLPNLHVLVTSRNEPDIDKALAPLRNFSLLSIQANQVQPDIHKYINSQLANDLELNKWPSSTKKEIENTLSVEACGMYKSSGCQSFLKAES